MEYHREVNILICYAPANRSYLDALTEEFRWLSERYDDVEVNYIDLANNFSALSRNQDLLQNAKVLILLLSNSFLRGTFYRQLLRNKPKLHREKEVIVLLIHRCPWQAESFFEPVQEELEEAMLLQQVFAQNEYEAFLVRLAGRIVGPSYIASRLDYVEDQKQQEALYH